MAKKDADGSGSAAPKQPEPGTAASKEKPEKTYTEAEHKAGIASAVKDRLKNVPSKDRLAELEAAEVALKERELADMSEIEAQTKRAKDLEEELEIEKELRKAEVAAREHMELQRKIAAEFGIEKSAHRLVGTNEEELRADAQTYLDETPSKTPANAGGAGGNPASDDKADDLRARFEKAEREGNSQEMTRILIEKSVEERST